MLNSLINLKLEDFDLVGVKALDSKTLKVTLKTKTPFF